MKSFESIACEAHAAFMAALPKKASTALYTWAELPPEIREAWIAASRKMAEEIQQVH